MIDYSTSTKVQVMDAFLAMDAEVQYLSLMQNWLSSKQCWYHHLCMSTCNQNTYTYTQYDHFVLDTKVVIVLNVSHCKQKTFSFFHIWQSVAKRTWTKVKHLYLFIYLRCYVNSCFRQCRNLKLIFVMQPDFNHLCVSMW